MVKLFEDYFEVSDLDREGKKFDRVSRINAVNDNQDIELVLDVNTEIYQLNIADKIQLLCTSQLDESLPNDNDQWRSTKNSIADDFPYVCHGKVYKFDESDAKAAAYVSFGGLLMCLSGPAKQLDKFHIGDNLYLLIRK
ncbi:MAG: hypothetical protein SGCHY_001582 [Lobulomycetales sp.]